MGKQKKGNKTANQQKDTVKSIKEGQVKKNKPQKFKQTPAGKVPLINGNGKANGVQQNPKKQQKPQQSPPNKNQKNSKKSPKNESPKKKPQAKKNEELKKEEEEEDSDEDINEGISIKEDISTLDEPDSEESDSDEETPDILGESLANDSDEDDDDFEADSDDEEEEDDDTKKGVKMFKGITKGAVKEESDEEDSDEGQVKGKKAKAKKGKEQKGKKEVKPKKMEVSEDDEEEDDDDDDDDEDEEVNTSAASSLNSSAITDEDDDDEDDDEEEEEDGPGLKALLGDSLVDQDDDEDFEGTDEEDDDEDEDISEEEEESQDEKNQSNDSARFEASPEKPRLSVEEKAEQDTRTIFIGNVPKDLPEKTLKKAFKAFGPIQSLRIRGVIPEDPKTSLKVAAIRKKFHHAAKTLCIYIVYKEAASVEKALEMNGQKLGGNYLRVDRIGEKRDSDPKKAVFVGGLAFGIEDNQLWEHFKDCGKIEYVRTVRDRRTGCCRGIGYINFASEDGATLALNLNNSKLANRNIHVSRYDPNIVNKSKEAAVAGKKRPFPGKQQGSPKKVKTEVETATENSLNAQKRKEKKQKGQNSQFQGQKAEGKKKVKKEGKFDKKKKTLAAKLLAKPKKGNQAQ